MANEDRQPKPPTGLRVTHTESGVLITWAPPVYHIHVHVPSPVSLGREVPAQLVQRMTRPLKDR